MSTIIIKLKNLYPVLSGLTIRGVGMFLQFLSTIIIARYLGAEQMGIYSVYLASMMVLAGFISLGSPSYVMKKVSVYFNDKDYSKIVHLLRYISLILLASTSVIAIIYFIIDKLFEHEFDLPINPFYIITGALFFIVLKVINESLKSIGKVNTSVFLESTLLAALMIGSVSLLRWIGTYPSAQLIAITNIGSTLVVFICAVWLFARLIPNKGKTKENHTPSIGELTPFWGNLLIVIGFINAPLLVLPFFASDSEVGLFSIAYRLILILINILGVLAAIFGPKFAVAASRNDLNELTNLLKSSGQFSLALFLPVALILTFFPTQILSLFGEEFTDAALPLFIMLIGQAIYAVTGLVGLFLSMTGHAKLEFKISIICIALMYSLLFIGGYYFGMLGATMAFSFCIAVKNLISLYASHMILRSISETN